jgi:hypothetical protein
VLIDQHGGATLFANLAQRLHDLDRRLTAQRFPEAGGVPQLLLADPHGAACLTVMRNVSGELVEPVGIRPTQCHRVEDPSRLYVTDDFITTQGTTVLDNVIVPRSREPQQLSLMLDLEDPFKPKTTGSTSLPAKVQASGTAEPVTGGEAHHAAAVPRRGPTKPKRAPKGSSATTA